MYLKDVSLDGTSYRLINKKKEVDKGSADNFFTVIVGENGSGKSEIIRNIILNILRSQLNEVHSKYNDKIDAYLDNNYKKLSNQRDQSIETNITLKKGNNDYAIFFKKTNATRSFVNFLGEEEYIDDATYRYENKILLNSAEVAVVNEDINIIAVSTSTFDKYPILQSMGHWSMKKTQLNYNYLGAINDSNSYRYRDKNNLEQKIELVASSLLKTIHDKKNIDYKLLFKFLGFDLKCKLYFTVESRSDINRNIQSSIGINEHEHENEKLIQEAKNHFSKNENNYFTKVDEVSSFEINLLDIDTTTKNDTFKYLATLTKNSMITFHNIGLYVKNKEFLFSQASSGQICIFICYIGIASGIKDNSLIFIDEPEISLHPEWQSNFIPLLKSIFSNFILCHFIIATHSPQILSSMNGNNDYILKLDTNEILQSNKCKSKSIDFYLASIFNSPGIGNDYIAAELIKILTNISNKGEISLDIQKRIGDILKIRKKITSKDPLNKLFSLLDSAIRRYEYDN